MPIKLQALKARGWGAGLEGSALPPTVVRADTESKEKTVSGREGSMVDDRVMPPVTIAAPEWEYEASSSKEACGQGDAAHAPYRGAALAALSTGAHVTDEDRDTEPKNAALESALPSHLQRGGDTAQPA
jgi:hypothetical protein